MGGGGTSKMMSAMLTHVKGKHPGLTFNSADSSMSQSRHDSQLDTNLCTSSMHSLPPTFTHTEGPLRRLWRSKWMSYIRAGDPADVTAHPAGGVRLRTILVV